MTDFPNGGIDQHTPAGIVDPAELVIQLQNKPSLQHPLVRYTFDNFRRVGAAEPKGLHISLWPSNGIATSSGGFPEAGDLSLSDHRYSDRSHGNHNDAFGDEFLS